MCKSTVSDAEIVMVTPPMYHCKTVSAFFIDHHGIHQAILTGLCSASRKKPAELRENEKVKTNKTS